MQVSAGSEICALSRLSLRRLVCQHGCVGGRPWRCDPPSLWPGAVNQDSRHIAASKSCEPPHCTHIDTTLRHHPHLEKKLHVIAWGSAAPAGMFRSGQRPACFAPWQDKQAARQNEGSKKPPKTKGTCPSSNRGPREASLHKGRSNAHIDLESIQPKNAAGGGLLPACIGYKARGVGLPGNTWLGKLTHVLIPHISPASRGILLRGFSPILPVYDGKRSDTRVGGALAVGAQAGVCAIVQSMRA